MEGNDWFVFQVESGQMIQLNVEVFLFISFLRPKLQNLIWVQYGL